MSELVSEDGPPDPARERAMISHSPEETFEFGRGVADHLTGGTAILLSGELGAGKTVLAKGIAAGLGIDPAEVTSPSFTLINVHEGQVPLYHIDLYRLEKGRCGNLGLDEIFEDPRAISVVEWPERLDRVPPGSIGILIEYVSDNERRITHRRG